jgi:hypothetical protein
MASDYIQYIIADKILIPENLQSSFSEKIVYLPDSYQVNDSKRKISSTEKNEENNWYRNCGLAIRKLSVQGVKLEYLLEFLVEHIIDTTLFHEKIEILNYLYSLDIVEERSFEGLAKEYLELTKTKSWTPPLASKAWCVVNAYIISEN